MRTDTQVREILEGLLGRVEADEASASYGRSDSLATRFGENAITQNMTSVQESVSLSVAFGSRHGSSSTNRMDAAALSQLIETATAIARTVPEDPEYVPVEGPQEYPAVPQHNFDDVAAAGPADLAAGICGAVDVAKAAGCRASGLYERSCWQQAMMTTRGLYASDRASHVSFSLTCHGAQGSGAASGCGEAMTQVDPPALATRARDTALAAQNPVDIEPGDYTVVFEPQAVSDLLSFVFWNLGARDADEGTTVFADNLGEAVADPRVTIRTVIDDPALPAGPYGQGGLPSAPRTWIENGVLRQLHHSRYWAREKGVAPDPILYPLVMDGGTESVDDLVARVDRGLLVKRLWYLRYVDHRDLLVTGMTRDGVFLLEDGQIAGPVINLRFNESPLVFLQNIEAMGLPTRVGNVKVPALLSHGFSFDSKTESV